MRTDNPEKFAYRSLDELKRDITARGLNIPVMDDVASAVPLFKRPIDVDGVTVPNRFCVHPLEGCDGDGEGTPSDLTFRRYARFAAGGSGMLWVEATAITPEGRANPRQIMITEKNKDSFKRLLETIYEHARDENGNPIRPYTILQLTHSGRYSKPGSKPAPIIFHHSPILDPTHKLPPDYPLVTDEYLDELQVLGGSYFAGLFHVKLPLAMPSFFSGLKIAATYSFVGAVIAGWVGGDRKSVV